MTDSIEQKAQGSDNVIKYRGYPHKLIFNDRFKNIGIYITVYSDEKLGSRVQVLSPASGDEDKVLFERKYDLNGEQVK